MTLTVVACKISGCTNKPSKGRGGFCYKHGRRGPRPQCGKGRTKAASTITHEEWLAIYYSQSGNCYLCYHKLWNRYSGQERNKKKERLAAVDHDHKIAKEKTVRESIRGLLCAYPCNRILRREMTSGWLQNAAGYVMFLPAQRVLAKMVPCSTSSAIRTSDIGESSN